MGALVIQLPKDYTIHTITDWLLSYKLVHLKKHSTFHILSGDGLMNERGYKVKVIEASKDQIVVSNRFMSPSDIEMGFQCKRSLKRIKIIEK